MNAHPEPQLVVAGRIGVDLYPEQEGPLRTVKTFAKSVGGSAANVAVGAARLGVRTQLISAVGDDALGEYLIAALGEFGVDAQRVAVNELLATPIVIAELNPAEDPALYFYRKPSAPDLQITGDVIDEAVINAPLAWITGTGLSAEPSRATTLGIATARGERPTVLDLDVRPHLWHNAGEIAEQLRAAIPHCDIVVGNRAEVEAAVGTADPDDAAARIRELGAKIVIVKCGADGVLGFDAQGERIHVAPTPVDVVCGLGAGDAFGAALCYGVLNEWPLERTLHAANAAGAIVASRLACADAMPTLAEITTFVQDHAHD